MDVDFTEKLIQEVRNRPILYLLSHPDYKNNTKKWQAWSEIGRELNEEVVPLKAKWKNLKDTYKKYKYSKQSTSSQAKKLQNWFWADHMSFIQPSVTPNETPSSINSPNVESDDDPTSNGEESRQDSERTQKSGPQETLNAQQITRHRRNMDPTDRIQYLQNRKRYRSLNVKKVDVKCDGIDLLFLGHADTLKKLSRRKQVNVKFAIAKILMEAELSDLDTATSESCSIAPDAKSSTSKQGKPKCNQKYRLMILNKYKLLSNAIGVTENSESHTQNIREQVMKATGISNEDLDNILNDSNLIAKATDPRKRKIESKQSQNKKLANVELNTAGPILPIETHINLSETPNALYIKCEPKYEEDPLEDTYIETEHKILVKTEVKEEVEIKLERDDVMDEVDSKFEFEPIMKCEPENQEYETN